MNIYSDGGSKGNPGDSIALIYLNDEFHYQLIGKATNNQAEYHAFILALKTAADLPDKKIDFFVDSQLIVGHITKDWKVNKNHQLVAEAKTLYNTLRTKKDITLNYIPRDQNKAGQIIEDQFQYLGDKK